MSHDPQSGSPASEQHAAAPSQDTSTIISSAQQENRYEGLAEKLTDDQILDFIQGNPVQIDLQDNEDQNPDPSAQQGILENPQDPQDETPETPPNPENQEEVGEKKKNRISIKGLPQDQQQMLAEAVSLVRKGEASTINEALGIVQRTAQEAPATEAATPPSQEDVAVSTIQEKLSQLRAQRKEAIANFDSEAQATLTDQIEDVLTELSEAKANAKAQAAIKQSAQTQYLAAVNELESTYPEAKDENSLFFAILNGKVYSARAENPNIELQNPRYLLQLAAEAKAQIESFLPKNPAPPTPKVNPKPEQPSRQAGSLIPAASPGVRVDPTAAREAISQINDLDELIGLATNVQ